MIGPEIPLTVEDLVRVELEHERIDGVDEDVGGRLRGDTYCKADGEDWPCDTIRLVDTVRELARAIVVGHECGHRSEPCPFCRRGPYRDDHEHDCPVLRARTLLGDAPDSSSGSVPSAVLGVSMSGDVVIVVRTTVPEGDADHVTVEVVAAKAGINTEVVAPLRCERTTEGWVLVEHDGRRRPPLSRDRALAALQATAMRWATEFLGWDWGGGDEWESA